MLTFRRSRRETDWHFLSNCKSWPMEDYEFVYRNLAEGPPGSVCRHCLDSASEVIVSWPGYSLPRSPD